MSFIQQNIKFIRKQKGLTQLEFSSDLNWSKSQIGAYEEGRAQPSIDKLIQLSDLTNIPIDILVKNDLRKSGTTSFIEVGNKRILFPIMVDDENENLIEVVPTKASAGYLLGYDDPEYIEQLEKIKLPFLPTGKHRAFPIKGDSMLPMKDGSYVVAEFVEDIKQAKSGYTYVIVTKDDGMTYKRIYNQVEENQSFLLKPDNSSYQPYEVPVSEIIELWKFTCSINTQEYDENELKLSSIIEMFNGLGVELEALKKSLL
ncbi:XRE family transcriptional regulator [Polaribacter reichenbachii]|uniref:XRE family transcriptional regulator n=1 Tax=Polaribacter reichenbachii TaxID=996801 RepID=A0A1B8TRG3_9FLAO|nr:LexA family transcriptional regulator [Polaribacter reichenbachii]APZ47814.1 XRE family transcriptional regulator [Polaribacter reichenbachii]AUC18449.1 XRE family transcriptional regulator [Polaribacter reichenbachii]OBY62200.1 XRE family transcriptional regulator [Polaribacter reichenbachii]